MWAADRPYLVEDLEAAERAKARTVVFAAVVGTVALQRAIVRTARARAGRAGTVVVEAPVAAVVGMVLRAVAVVDKSERERVVALEAVQVRMSIPSMVAQIA